MAAIYRPLPFAEFVSTNLPVPTDPAWAAGESYTAGDVVILSTDQPIPWHAFEAISSHTSDADNAPKIGGTAEWLDLGAINRHRWFDGYNNSATVSDPDDDALRVVLDVDGVPDYLCLLGLENVKRVLVMVYNPTDTPTAISIDEAAVEQGLTDAAAGIEPDATLLAAPLGDLNGDGSITAADVALYSDWRNDTLSDDTVRRRIENILHPTLPTDLKYSPYLSGTIPLQFYDPSDSAVVTDGPVGWYTWLFGEYRYRGASIIQLKLPFADARIQIALTGSQVKCAQCFFARRYDLGQTEDNVEPRILSYSTFEPDDFGNYRYVARQNTREMNFTTWVESRQFDRVFRTLERLEPELMLFDANNPGSDFDSLRVYGKITQFRPGLRYARTPIDIRILGLN